LLVELRPLQVAAINGLSDSFRNGKRKPLLYGPCGFGKTYIFCYLISKIIESGRRVIVLVHREELLEQVSLSLSEFAVPHSFIAAGFLHNPGASVHVASVFTLIRRVQKIQAPDYIIVDEAQHCISTSSWGKVIAAFPNARVIGVSGSPVRLSGEALGDVFDDLVLGPSTRELIEQGWLSKYRLFTPADINRNKLHTRMGDFVKSEVSDLMDKPKIVGDAVSEWKKHADGLQTAVFCVSVEHAHHIAQEYRNAGVNAIAVDGGTERPVRRQIVKGFADGSIRLIASCDLLSEGWDCPGIFCGQFLRPTASLGLYIQQVGRCIRAAPGKEHAILLDHVGNTRVHGPIDQAFEWSLSGSEARRKKKREDDEPKIRTCPVCSESYGLHVRVCNCGEILVQSREVDESEGELTEVDPALLRREKYREQARAQDLEQLTEIGRRRGHKFPQAWARHVLRAREEKAAAKRRQATASHVPTVAVQQEDPWLF
jgi:superfamily II DNA or RNA helicase